MEGGAGSSAPLPPHFSLNRLGGKDSPEYMFLGAGFTVELQLDWQKQKGGVRRALFLASRQATLTQTLLIQNGAREDCREMKIYLRVWPNGAENRPGLERVSQRPGAALEKKKRA